MGIRFGRNTVTGQLKLPTTGSSGGVLIGEDAGFYRGAANRIDLITGDSLFIPTTSKIYFFDTGMYLYASGDGTLRVISDGNIILDPVSDVDVQGNVDIGANLLKTTNLAIKENDADTLIVRNVADSAAKNLRVSSLYVEGGVKGINLATSIAAANTDDATLLFKARDNGVGLVEVARLAGAADPYFAMGGSQEHKFFNGGNIGFFSVAGQAQQAHIADPTDLATCISVLTTVLADLEGYGLLASA